MSDSRIYELEDIVWEFCDNDDHIVPHTRSKKSGISVGSDCNKRPQLEQKSAEGYADNRSASDNILRGQEGTIFNIVKEEKNKMLEKSGGFSDSLDGDLNEKNSCSASEEDRTFEHCMRNSNIDPISDSLCADDPMLDRVASEDNLYQYQLNNATPTESDLAIYCNNLDDKESNDLLYYGWNDIENFEDVDRMFRSCDSTFGLDLDNSNEMGWFSSSHAIEGSDDAKLSFDFSGCGTSGLESATEQEIYGLNNVLATDESEKKGNSQNLTANGNSTVINSSYVNGSRTSSIDCNSQILSHVSKPKNQKTSDSGASLVHFDDVKQAVKSNQSLNFQCSFSSENQQQATSLSNCVRMSILLVNSNNGLSSNQVLPSLASSINKSEDSGIPSISLKDSSYASSKIQSLDGAHECSIKNPSVTRNMEIDRHHQRRVSGNPDKSKFMVPTVDTDPLCPQKFSDFGNEVEGQSEFDGDIDIATELDSSNIQESSCISTVLDEVSIDASSFQQLQDVMEKLDIRTKLCIRDSLYRLARSAERRHQCVDPSSSDKDDKATSGALLSEATNKCAGFMDMETDTNPIDRSIAHLLFHRPLDPSANPSTTATLEILPAKLHTVDQARNHSSLIAEKPACQEETTPANGEATKH